MTDFLGEYGSSVASEILMDFGRMRALRYNFEAHWREIAERVIPNDSFLFQQNPNSFMFTKGEKRTQFLFDSTALVALERFAAILDSLLTPRNQIWHSLKANDPVLNRNRQVKMWLEDVTTAIFKYRYAPQSNFASQNNQHYLSLGGYGTGGTFIDALAHAPGIRYKCVHLSELYFRENHQGIVDQVTRYFAITARQAFQWFGEAIPDTMKEMMHSFADTEFRFVHSVRPRKEYDSEKLDSTNMPWESIYVSEQGRMVVAEGGFRTFPYAISRYMQSTNEAYGRSPAMNVLPAIKTLNEEKKTMLKAMHRQVDPILLAYDDGIVDTFNARPGAINAGGVSADGRPLVHPLPTGDYKIGQEGMDDERKLINDSFLISIFQILTETPTMTATEVMERAKEKGILLTPTVGRQESEKLGPMINREIDLLSQQGLLPPPPRIIGEARGKFEYEVQYDSPLSRAQRAEEASGTLRAVEAAINVSTQTQNPEPLDHFNWDEIIPEISDIYGVPEKFLNDPAKIAQLRATRAQAQQVQQAQQLAPGIAAITKSNAIADKQKSQ